MDRGLDGCYFRVQRDGRRYESVCFSDLTVEDRTRVMEGRSGAWLRSLCHHLAERLRAVGDEFDIIAENEEGQK